MNVTSITQPTPTRNLEALNLLADFIENEGGVFNYGDVDTCMIGWGWRCFDLPRSDLGEAMLRDKLGISEREANRLFYAPTRLAKPGEEDDTMYFSNITKEVAARTLRHFAETGDTRFICDAEPVS